MLPIRLMVKLMFIIGLLTPPMSASTLSTQQILQLQRDQQQQLWTQRRQQHSHSQQHSSHRFSSSLCSDKRTTSSLLELAEATAAVMNTIDTSDFYVAFQEGEDGDICFLQILWEEGFSLKSSTASHWWRIISTMSYQHTSQHLLVGSWSWITDILKKVKQLYEKGSLSSHRTQWLWVVTDEDQLIKNDHIFPSSSSASLSSPLSPSLPSSSSNSSFSVVAKDISSMLAEVFRGLVLLQESRSTSEGTGHSTVPPSSGSNVLSRWIIVGAVDTNDSSQWEIKMAATWSKGDLRVTKPLWPRPVYNFQGRVVPISCLKKASVFEFNDDDFLLSHARGYLAEVMKVIVEGLNITAVLVPTRGGGSKNADGTWNGIVGVLTREEAAIGALDFTPSLSRSQVVDFSIPIGQDPTIILSSAPLLLIRPFLLLQIFSPAVWGCLIGLVFIGCFTLWGLGRAEAELGIEKASILSLHLREEKKIEMSSAFSYALVVFKILVLQSNSHLPKGSGGRLVTALIMLVALVVGSLYNGSITAFLVIPFKSKPINSVSDLLSAEVIPTVRSKTNIQTYTVNQEGGALYKVKSRVAVMSGGEVATLDFHDKMAQGSHALVDVYSAALGRANKFTKRGEKCKFHVSRENVQVNPDALAFRRNSPYLTQFDFLIRNLQYFGIMEYIKRKHVMVLCEAEISRDGPEPMSLLQAQGPFIVLGVGLLLAFVVFFSEFVFSC